MGNKRDGRYYIRGMINKRHIETSRPDYVHIDFLVDTTQPITRISQSQALKHGIEYKNLSKETIPTDPKNCEVYVLRDRELRFTNPSNSHQSYGENFDKIFIPDESFSEDNPEAHISRLGLDFLEKFTISFLEPEPKSGGIILEKKNSES